jgi:hypothetical protein
MKTTLSVKGIYEDGHVHLLEMPNLDKSYLVTVTFVQERFRALRSAKHLGECSEPQSPCYTKRHPLRSLQLSEESRNDLSRLLETLACIKYLVNAHSQRRKLSPSVMFLSRRSRRMKRFPMDF